MKMRCAKNSPKNGSGQKSRSKLCGGKLWYEQICGMRIAYGIEGKKFYKFLCTRCGHEAFTKGSRKTCNKLKTRPGS